MRASRVGNVIVRSDPYQPALVAAAAKVPQLVTAAMGAGLFGGLWFTFEDSVVVPAMDAFESAGFLIPQTFVIPPGQRLYAAADPTLGFQRCEFCVSDLDYPVQPATPMRDTFVRVLDLNIVDSSTPPVKIATAADRPLLIEIRNRADLGISETFVFATATTDLNSTPVRYGCRIWGGALFAGTVVSMQFILAPGQTLYGTIFGYTASADITLIDVSVSEAFDLGRAGLVL